MKRNSLTTRPTIASPKNSMRSFEGSRASFALECVTAWTASEASRKRWPMRCSSRSTSAVESGAERASMGLLRNGAIGGDRADGRIRVMTLKGRAKDTRRPAAGTGSAGGDRVDLDLDALGERGDLDRRAGRELP